MILIINFNPFESEFQSKSGKLDISALNRWALLRLNILPLIKAINRTTQDFLIVNLHYNKMPLELLEKKIDLCIVGQVLASRDEENSDQLANSLLPPVARLKRLGVTICTLFCDNHFASQNDITKRNSLYQDLLYFSDYSISPTNPLAKIAKKNQNLISMVIPEPCQLERYPFRKKEGSTCRIIWFGNGHNLNFLLDSLESILKNCKASEHFELTILTKESFLKNLVMQKLQHTLKAFQDSFPSKWTFRLVAWDSANQPTQLQDELNRADISFIPSDAKDPRKTAASANRVFDSVQAGCIVVSAPLESYSNFKICSLQGYNYSKLIDTAWEYYDQLTEEFKNTRRKPLSIHAETKNLASWASFLEEAHNHHQ